MGEFRGLSATGFACLAATLVVMGGTPAAAQASFEFGYKDRTFAQEFELPPEDATSALRAFQIQQAKRALANPVLLSASENSEARRFLGGLCAEDYLSSRKSSVRWTPELRAILDLPDTSSSPSSSRSPFCRMQFSAFHAALVDPGSTDAQLAWLADTMRRRFATDWLSNQEMSDPGVQRGADKLKELRYRTGLLQDKGMPLPDDILDQIERGVAKSQIMALKDPAVAAALDARLAAIEKDAPAAIRAQRQADKEKAYIKELMDAADGAVAGARFRLDEAKSFYENAAIRARLDPNTNSDAAQKAASWAERMKEQEEKLRAAIAAREKLVAHLAKATTSPQAQPASPPPLEPPQLAAIEDDGGCAEGQRCRVVEKTIVCMTLDRLQSVLAQPAGAKRRTVLRVLTARGECATLEAGVGVIARGNVHHVTPIGEAPVEAITVTLGTGQAGFMLASALGIARQAGQ
ncbi:hypothetical protein [Aquabacter cavernae]|uniref:hypothetical protein n=1 Tax=Aquabacter cavernae TaxID=2496029 RepID=UPI000F8DCE78|nr:hypothetical protein [Aquabacter cavernae]